MYQKEWDVLWATADECDMPISFHTLGIPTRTPEGESKSEYAVAYDGIRECLFQLSGAEFLVSAVYSGACMRYPNFPVCSRGMAERLGVTLRSRAYGRGIRGPLSPNWP